MRPGRLLNSASTEFYDCRRALAAHDRVNVFSPSLQRATSLDDVVGLVVGPGDTGLMPDMRQYALDDMRCDAERLVHRGRNQPAQVVQHPVRPRAAHGIVERNARS